MSDRKLTILYGSQTGTAQDVAEQIGRDAIRYRFNVTVNALDNYNIVNLTSEPMVVFVVATTGQGDPPNNMKKFWRFIWRKNLPPNSLTGFQYGVLGLGDSSYEKFNFIAKKLNKRISLLGGRSIIDIGLADDQHELGYCAVADEWIRALWNRVAELLPLPAGVSALAQSVLLPPKYRVTFVNDEVVAPVSSINLHQEISSSQPCELTPFNAELVENIRITSTDHWQDVRLLTFDITDSNITFSPGDVLCVRPENQRATVDDFIDLLGLDPSATLTVDAANLLLPQPCSVRHLVTKYLDINSIPKRYFWELMSKFTDSDLERDKLTEFCTPAGQEELYSYCNRPRRTILEILHDFPNATRNIPFDYLFDMIGKLRSREFSIASSQQVDKNKLQLLVAVVKYKTKLVAPRYGICSSYLANLNQPEPDGQSSCRRPRVAVWVEKGTFQFPTCAETPVIMIGPGTGCAPFRSFIQQRAMQSASGNYLFFGCRNKEKDFYCRDEWHRLEEASLMKLFVAFSRDQDHKVYVQHLLLEQGDLLWRLIDNEQACIFVAGNAKNMPASVREALKKIVMSHGNRTNEEAEHYLNELSRLKRYQLETWS